MNAQVAGKRPLGAVGRAGVVVGMHAAVLFVIAQGFVLKNERPLPEPLVGTIIDDPVDVDPLPNVAPRDPAPPDIYVPVPDVPIDNPPANDAVVAQVLPPDAGIVELPGGSGPDIPTTNVRMLAGGLTQPPYPAADVRAGNEGNVQIEVYVLPDGRVGDARILRSSGFPRLDQAALDEAKRRWRLQPATRNGEPFAQWYPLRVVFKLKKQ